MPNCLFLGVDASAHAQAGADFSLTRDSTKGLFRVTLQPPIRAAAINEIHTWQINLTNSKGQAIRDAGISVDGGMPDHGHGLPTKPQANKQIAEGVYLLEGMKFSMTGRWEIRLTIRALESTDIVVFNTLVEHPPPKLP